MTVQANQPSLGMHACNTLLNFYPSDNAGFYETGSFQVDRATDGQLGGFMLLPEGDIIDENHGEFAGQIVQTIIIGVAVKLKYTTTKQLAAAALQQMFAFRPHKDVPTPSESNSADSRTGEEFSSSTKSSKSSISSEGSSSSENDSSSNSSKTSNSDSSNDLISSDVESSSNNSSISSESSSSNSGSSSKSSSNESSSSDSSTNSFSTGKSHLSSISSSYEIPTSTHCAIETNATVICHTHQHHVTRTQYQCEQGLVHDEEFLVCQDDSHHHH